MAQFNEPFDVGRLDNRKCLMSDGFFLEAFKIDLSTMIYQL